MILRPHFVLTLVALCLVFRVAAAQEAPSAKAGDTPPPGVDKKYFDLTHSKDAKVKGLAERYVNLVKFQEWSTASGKAIIARYVSHDADLKHVKLAVPKGNGKDRVVTEYNVDVEKLGKSGQARVKQIDTIQKRLDEMAATGKAGDAAGAQPGPEGAAPPAREERGAHAQNAAGPEASTPPQAAAPQAGAQQPDPSESEPDPLGFAELPPAAAPGPPPGPGQ